MRILVIILIVLTSFTYAHDVDSVLVEQNIISKKIALTCYLASAMYYLTRGDTGAETKASKVMFFSGFIVVYTNLDEWARKEDDK